MRVQHVQASGGVFVELLDDADQPFVVVSQFLHHLSARGYSPNTISAYAYDLLHFTQFLSQQLLTFEEFTPAHSLAFLDYLSHIPSRGQAHRAGLVLCTTTENGRSTSKSMTPAVLVFPNVIGHLWDMPVDSDLSGVQYGSGQFSVYRAQ